MATSRRPTRFGLRKVLLVWNSVVLIVFTIGWGYVSLITSLNGPLRVTAIDRVGAIDEAALRQAYPDLAVNLRHNLGMWIAEKERQAACSAMRMGVVVAGANIAMVLLLWRTKSAPVDEGDLLPKR